MSALQRELFSILDEFFSRATGTTCEKFASFGEFGDRIRSNSTRLGRRALDAYPWAYDALANFYSKYKTDLFTAGKQSGGLKLVLGGGSRFGQTQFDSVRKMLLYADTILIPDPVLPWLEADRREERFRHVLWLETCHALLHLKPLVDANLPSPPVLVFPSWEKTLEQQDAATREGIDKLVVSLLSRFLKVSFSTVDECVRYAQKCPDEFLGFIDQNALFVPPEGAVGTPLKAAIKAYKTSIQTWRSPEFVAMVQGWNDAELVLNGVIERLVPQYHLLDNADNLSAQPMLCLAAHEHYYTVCACAFQTGLIECGLLSAETVQTLRALNRPDFEWLGDVTVEALVRLRLNNENEDFRRRLNDFVHGLGEASLQDLDRVTAEVARGIGSLLIDHQQQLQKIQSKYTREHAKTAAELVLTLAALFVPSLAPFVPIIGGIGGVGKYAFNKIDEFSEKRAAAKSMMGVLASANSKSRSR